MSHASRATYPPLNTLKRVADNLWIVDGPIIRFGAPWLKMPFTTRMTVIRLTGRDLFVHSPTPLVSEIRAEIEQAGRPRWIVGPNRLPYWWIPEWKAAFPDAIVHLAPRTRERAGDRIDFDCCTLADDSGYEWDAEIATLPIAGRYMTEFEFFHHASRTLVLTDFVENFEPHKLDSLVMRWLARIGGVQHPDGGMPRDMRLTFARRKPQLRAAIEKMIGWNPEQIILAHGRWYERDGTAELRRAFRWLLA